VITAIVLISADVHAIDETAQAVADVDGVREVYSCAGDVDLIAIVAVRDHERVASVVTGTINKLPGVRHTATHIAFKAYSSSDVDAGFAIGE
jgi:DNA-binding Lrp family transcriptional regulator